MSKPEDIPQDVWERASKLSDLAYLDFSPVTGATAIARAIMAETEACAQIADNHLVPSKRIAAAIRNRSTQP